jgi:hypothetical protein
MNPYMAQALIHERTRDLLTEAHRNSLAARLRSALRAQRQEQHSFASVAVPEIPDYVHELLDGSEVEASKS